MGNQAWQVSFELHVLKRGRWTIEHSSDDRELVVTEMQDLIARGGIEGVRLIREIYDQSTDKSVVHVQHEQLLQRTAAAAYDRHR